MKIEYFSDTDTLLLEFSENTVQESRDLNENTLVEFDSAGKLVSMTIEHAKDQANMEEFVFHPGQSIGHSNFKVAEESIGYKTKKEES